MLRSCVRAGALILAGTLLCSGMDVQAAGLSSVLPNGGINIALDQGTSLENISAEAGKTDPLFAKLDEIVKANGGLWCAKAEEYLLANAPKIEER